MSDLTYEAIPTQGKSSATQAFGLALLIEVALVAGVAGLLASSSAIQAAHEPAPLTLAQAEPEPEKKPDPKPEPKPEPVKMVSKVAPPKTPTPPQQPVVTEPTPPLAAVESDVQTAFAQPAPVKASPPPQQPTTGKVDPNAEYAGKVHEAVQAAYFYPAAAAAMRFSGRVRVEFQLKDGHVTESHVLQTCGIGLFDKAALQAVQVAHYPAPPEQLRGQDLHYQIWVELATH